MRTLGRIAGVVLFWSSVVGNILVLLAILFGIAKIAGFWWGVATAFSALMVILTSVNLFGVHFIHVFPGRGFWLAISIFLFAVSFGQWTLEDDYISSLWTRKQAVMTDEAIKNNVAESELESFLLKEGTALYRVQGKKVVLHGDLSIPLVVRLKPERIDIGVIYREVILPVKVDKVYIPGKFDSNSEHFFIEAMELVRGRKEEKIAQAAIAEAKLEAAMAEKAAAEKRTDDMAKALVALAAKSSTPAPAAAKVAAAKLQPPLPSESIVLTSEMDQDPDPRRARFDIPPVKAGDKLFLEGAPRASIAVNDRCLWEKKDGAATEVVVSSSRSESFIIFWDPEEPIPKAPIKIRF